MDVMRVVECFFFFFFFFFFSHLVVVDIFLSVVKILFS